MTSLHDGYAHLKDLVQDLAADVSVNSALRNRLSNLHTQMSDSDVTIGHADMGLIIQGLGFVTDNKELGKV